ncbi:hypothetical protein BJX96DRAFT_154243 [Aspergillus floccosus]
MCRCRHAGITAWHLRRNIPVDVAVCTLTHCPDSHIIDSHCALIIFLAELSST